MSATKFVLTVVLEEGADADTVAGRIFDLLCETNAETLPGISYFEDCERAETR